MTKESFLLAGDISCGLFGIAEDFEETYLSLDEHLCPNRESTYFLRASGDSMQPLIAPGDILVVDRSATVASGNIVIVALHGEHLCKRLLKKEQKILLISESNKYRPIELQPDEELQIFGTVVALARKLIKCSP